MSDASDPDTGATAPMLPNLGRNWLDWTSMAVTSMAAAIPGIGMISGPVAQVLSELLPNQIQRITDFLVLMEQRIRSVEDGLRSLEKNISTPSGREFFEEGLRRAARISTEERRRRLANLLSRALTEEEFNFTRAQKLQNLLADLTDAELVMLAYHSRPSDLTSQWHAEMQRRYPEILDPASRELQAGRDEAERRALQDGYENTLIRLGLLRERREGLGLTPLGEVLFRYIQDEDDGVGE